MAKERRVETTAGVFWVSSKSRYRGITDYQVRRDREMGQGLKVSVDDAGAVGLHYGETLDGAEEIMRSYYRAERQGLELGERHPLEV